MKIKISSPNIKNETQNKCDTFCKNIFYICHEDAQSGPPIICFHPISTWELVEHIWQWPLLYSFIALKISKLNKINNLFATFSSATFCMHVNQATSPKYMNHIHCQWSIHKHAYLNQLKRGLKT